MCNIRGACVQQLKMSLSIYVCVFVCARVRTYSEYIYNMAKKNLDEKRTRVKLAMVTWENAATAIEDALIK